MLNDRKRRNSLRNAYWGFETEPLPVEDGIRARNETGRFAQSWWGERWIKALTQTINPARLARGKAYARHGQVTQLDVQVGLVTAHVQGTRPKPYRSRIVIKTLDDAAWQRVIRALVSQASYATQLLNGEMPREIEELFRSAGLSLFPEHPGDLETDCTCPDWANPCKHVAAVCLLLGEMLDEDPFLLFVMRGRTKDQIMAALRQERADRAQALDLRESSTSPSGTGQPAQGVPLEACLERFWEMGAEANRVRVRVAPPEIEMEMIKVLGSLPFGEDKLRDESLAETYRAVSRKALEVAFVE